MSRDICLRCLATSHWWRGQDLNLRPSGYEPDELPSCSTPRRSRACTVANSHIHNNPPGSVDNSVGLFSEKPKSIIVPRPDEMAAPGVDPMDRLEQTLPIVTDLPQLAPPPPKATPANPPKPPKQMKQSRKVGVDPADFLALRAELIDMRARLDESEQARALVEARLSSLDAATAAFSTERGDIDEISDAVAQLQKQVAENTNNPVANNADSSAGRDELSAKVDALQNRLFGMQDQT